MKRPSFQFYPSDWLRDTALRTCSTGARGLWMDMICYMHEGTPYGYLKVGNKVILPSNLARMVGESLDIVEGWLAELKEAGVYDIDEDGSICSRRMIRDESLRNMRAEFGKLGGNPNLKDKGKVENKVKQNLTPSSSSSSSSTKDIYTPPEGVDFSVWNDYLKLRRAKKLPMTATALKGIQREADKAKKTLNETIIICVENSWAGFKAEWLEKEKEKKQDKTWMFSDKGIENKAKELGLKPNPHDTYHSLKERCIKKMAEDLIR